MASYACGVIALYAAARRRVALRHLGPFGRRSTDASAGGSRIERNAGGRMSAHWRAPAETPEVAAPLCRVAHPIRPEGAAAAGARTSARTPPRRPTGFESAALCSSDGAGQRCALSGCGRRAGAAAFGLRHSIWRVGVAAL